MAFDGEHGFGACASRNGDTDLGLVVVKAASHRLHHMTQTLEVLNHVRHCNPLALSCNKPTATHHDISPRVKYGRDAEPSQDDISRGFLFNFDREICTIWHIQTHLRFDGNWLV